MGSTGDRETDTRKIRSINSLITTIHSQFPNHSYNFGTLVLYLARLQEREMVVVVHRHQELRYRLTSAGFDEARKLWDERHALGYVEPASSLPLESAVTLIAISTKEFLPAAV